LLGRPHGFNRWYAGKNFEQETKLEILQAAEFDHWSVEAVLGKKTGKALLPIKKGLGLVAAYGITGRISGLRISPKRLLDQRLSKAKTFARRSAIVDFTSLRSASARSRFLNC